MLLKTLALVLLIKKTTIQRSRTLQYQNALRKNLQYTPKN